jgi:hypothetical protein
VNVIATVTAPNVWGTLPSWLALLGMIGLGVILLRGGVGTAVEGLQATNRELQRQISELQQKVDGLTKENAELRGRTDVALAIEPVIRAVRTHEEQAAKRSVAMLDVLDLIATRLGKEPDDDRQAGL